MSRLEVLQTRLDNADSDVKRELLAAVESVAGEASFILGEEGERFECEFAAYCGTSPADLGLDAGSVPTAEDLAERICSLPLSPGPTDEEIAWTARSVGDFRLHSRAETA